MRRHHLAVNLMGVVAALVALGSCTALRPAPLPVVPASMQRATIRVGAMRCLRSSCRTTVDIGGEPLQVEARARVMSREKALGERRSLTSILFRPVIDEMLVSAGGSVGRDQIGLGTRVVTVRGDSSTRLRCSVGWVQEEMRTRRDGEEVYTSRRIAEGMDCEIVHGPDSVVTWRVHAGLTPTPASLVRTSDSLIDRDRLRLDLQLQLTRMIGATPSGYAVVLDSATTSVLRAPLSVWGVVRPDGLRIGTLLWRYGVGTSALDISGAATSEERRVLRLVAAALVAPLVATE
jgi:hypothetical protein